MILGLLDKICIPLFIRDYRLLNCWNRWNRWNISSMIIEKTQYLIKKRKI